MAERMAALPKQGFADIFIPNPGSFALPDLPGLSNAYVCYLGEYIPTTCL